MQGKVRMIRVCYWDDPYVLNLLPTERYLYLYLMLTPLNNIAGMYEITDKTIVYHTGLGQKQVTAHMNKLTKDGKILRFDSWLIIVNHLKHQELKSSLTRKGIFNIISAMPKDVVERTLQAPCMSLSSVIISDIMGYDISQFDTKKQAPCKPLVSPLPKKTRPSDYSDLDSDFNSDSKLDLDSKPDYEIPAEFQENVKLIRNYISENEFRKGLEKKAEISDQNLVKLLQSHSYHFVTECIKRLYSYIQSSGKRYKNEYMAINSWVIEEVNKKTVNPKLNNKERINYEEGESRFPGVTR